MATKDPIKSVRRRSARATNIAVFGADSATAMLTRVAIGLLYIVFVYFFFDVAEASIESWMVVAAILPAFLIWPVVYLFQRDSLLKKDLSRSAAILQKKHQKADLQAGFEQVLFSTTDDPSVTAVIIAISIRNTGVKKTAAEHFDFWYKCVGENLPLTIVQINGEGIFSGPVFGAQTKTINGDDLIFNKALKAIKVGEVCKGWAVILVKRDLQPPFDEHELTIEFTQTVDSERKSETINLGDHDQTNLIVPKPGF